MKEEEVLWNKPSYRLLKTITGIVKILPDFLIIGCAKGGTTSLYYYLIQHSNIASASGKELWFFDTNFKRGLIWYRSNFPTVFFKYYEKIIHHQKIITGEASTNYIFHPLAAKRTYSVLPDAKIILLLRNPIDRAYSSWAMHVRRGTEKLSFEEAIKQEEERIAGEEQKILENEYYDSFKLMHYSYLKRGIYIEQIKKWMKLFPKNRFLIIKTEDFKLNTKKTMSEIFDFLEVPNFDVNQKRENVGKYTEMNPETRNLLIEYFKPHNKKLYKYLGRNFDWDK